MMLDNKRITKNTAVLYLRMLVSMFVSFYTSRIILEILGVEDFGIYNVVGGAASIVTFFTGSLTNVSQRYFNIGLGHEDLNMLRISVKTRMWAGSSDRLVGYMQEKLRIE